MGRSRRTRSFEGQGFWARIRGIVGIAADRKTVTGITFYEQSETPGLGAEIVRPAFRNQFKGKLLAPKERPITMRRPGTTLARAMSTPSPAPRRPAGGSRRWSTGPSRYGSLKWPRKAVHYESAVTGSEAKKIAIQGLWRDNPIFRQVLGSAAPWP